MEMPAMERNLDAMTWTVRVLSPDGGKEDEDDEVAGEVGVRVSVQGREGKAKAKEEDPALRPAAIPLPGHTSYATGRPEVEAHCRGRLTPRHATA